MSLHNSVVQVVQFEVDYFVKVDKRIKGGAQQIKSAG